MNIILILDNGITKKNKTRKKRSEKNSVKFEKKHQKKEQQTRKPSKKTNQKKEDNYTSSDVILKQLIPANNKMIIKKKNVLSKKSPVALYLTDIVSNVIKNEILKHINRKN